jgi:predicted Rossmann fold nucleotide-binding protein DprA/Smf involved in DNA uptake
MTDLPDLKQFALARQALIQERESLMERIGEIDQALGVGSNQSRSTPVRSNSLPGAILTALQGGSLTLKQLAVRLSRDAPRVSQSLSAMKRQKLVTNLNGAWSLVAKEPTP